MIERKPRIPKLIKNLCRKSGVYYTDNQKSLTRDQLIQLNLWADTMNDLIVSIKSNRKEK